ncbi:hypothetical protein D3C78_1311740 [compost metagenome]
MFTNVGKSKIAMMVPIDAASKINLIARNTSNSGWLFAKSIKFAVIGAWIRLAVLDTSTIIPVSDKATAILFSLTPAYRIE